MSFCGTLTEVGFRAMAAKQIKVGYLLVSFSPCPFWAERRPRPILRRTRRPADVNKAGDALMRRQAEGIEHTAVVGVPFGYPVCRVAERVRGEDIETATGTASV